MVVGLGSNQYAYLRNDDGVFASPNGPVTVAGLNGAVERIGSTAIGDFDGDGAGDLVLATDSDSYRPRRLMFAGSDSPTSF